MATHHADEISPVFRHVLLLGKGRVSAAGTIADTLTSDNISKTFGSPLRLERRDHHFHITRPRRG
jgi:iron complex transport system ATP-binding protein